MQEQEIWRDVPGYNGLYQVSDLGRVKKIKYSKYSTERFVKLKVDSSGYYRVGFQKNKVRTFFRIHQLVMIVFKGHKPDGYNGLIIDHINDIKTDNRLCNLQAVTQRYNINKNNKNKYMGVYLDKRTDIYHSSICVNGKSKHLGMFKDKEEAKKYHDNALKNINNNEDIKVKKRKYSSEYVGVWWNKNSKKWAASVWENKKNVHLGFFNDEYEAHLKVVEYKNK